MRVVLLLLLVAAPLAGAQQVLTDPRGDSVAANVPGFEWSDVLAAGFDANETGFTGWIDVVAGAPSVTGEFGLVFGVDDRFFMVGFTTVVPDYRGPFFCRFDGPGDLDGVYSCEAGNGTLVGGHLQVFVRYDEVGNDTGIQSPWAWSEASYMKFGPTRMDTTDVGIDLVWADADAPPDDEPPAPGETTPWPAAAVAVLVAALWRRRGTTPL